MKIKVLAAMALALAAAANAQQTPAPQLEVPYDCAGVTITIHRCGNVGGQDVCMYRVDIPGGQSMEGNKPRADTIAQLKSCKLKPGGGASAPGGPLNPPYLKEMPPVEKVLQSMKTSDPRETALRQMGAFYQLIEIIATLSGPREIRGYMPDEQRFVKDYTVAAYQVGQAANAAFPGPFGTENTLSANHPYRFSRNDPRFGFKGIPVWQTFLSPGLQAQFAKIIGADNAKYEAKVAEQKRASADALVAAHEPPGGNESNGMKNDPGSVAARRCLESGRDQMECMGQGIKTGLNDLFGGFVGGVMGSDIPAASTGPAGLRISGDFSAANARIIFSEPGAKVACGTLVPQDTSYTVERSGSQILVKVAIAPKVLSATLRPDGKLVGPGLVEVAGRVVVGTTTVGGGSGGYEAQTHTTTQERQIAAADVPNYSADAVHQNGMESSVSEQHTSTTYEPAATHRRVEPITAPKTEHCNIGVIQGKPPVGLVAGLSAIVDPSTAKAPPKPYGLRLAGTYAGPGGLSIEFRIDSATVECGEAHVAMPYNLENTANGIQVGLKNPTGPFTLSLRPDGNFDGSGTVNLAGRVITGSRGDDIVYAPRNASCPVGTLAPKN
jgi:hypothetical protein